MKLGYLGPSGTFSEQAAFIVNGKYNFELKKYRTIWEVLESVDKSNIDIGVVPIENSTEGIVNITVDSIIFDINVFIQSEIILSVKHNFMVNKNCKANNITKVLSHPQALAQCRMFLQKNYPNAELINTTSTSEAVKIVSESSENWAAIGVKRCADIYNLNIIHENIQDSNNNYTQFVVISKSDIPLYKNFTNTSIAFSTLHQPGQLYRLLDIFSIWDLNLTKIISRPMRNKAGEYVFFVEIESNNKNKDLNDALKMIQRKTSFFKNLGSYYIYDYR